MQNKKNENHWVIILAIIIIIIIAIALSSVNTTKLIETLKIDIEVKKNSLNELREKVKSVSPTVNKVKNELSQ